MLLSMSVRLPTQIAPHKHNKAEYSSDNVTRSQGLDVAQLATKLLKTYHFSQSSMYYCIDGRGGGWAGGWGGRAFKVNTMT